ncbi:hypothetical protein N431DRAFT_465674 [Stipitochalara longipes BDJ]|nr:hypothetical protein N431DRAFT_465674 [Stipitochalara longipes BDJ]
MATRSYATFNPKDYLDDEPEEVERITDACGVPIHDPLPGSPAAFAIEAARRASQQANVAFGNQSPDDISFDLLSKDDHDTGRETNEIRNKKDTNDNPQESPIEPPLKDSQGDESIELPQDIMNILDGVCMIVSVGSGGEPVRCIFTRQQWEEFQQSLTRHVSTMGTVEQEIAPPQSQVEPGSSFAGSVTQVEARFPEKNSLQDVGEKDFDEVEFEEFDAGEETLNGENTNSNVERDSDNASDTDSASSTRDPVLPGKKKQTKPPSKRVRQNPRTTDPEWPEFLQQPLTQQVLANPGGYKKAHDFIAIEVRNVIGLKSITKNTGLIKQNGREGVNDWKAGVITHFLNGWILHKHGLVLFRHGATDHGAQMAWYDSRPRVEQDEYRIWIMPKVEAALQPGDRVKVQNMRQTQEPIVGALNISVAAGTWRHPTLGGGMTAPVIPVTQTVPSSVQPTNNSGIGITVGLLGGVGTGHTSGFNGGNDSVHGGFQAAPPPPRACNAPQFRKRKRNIEDDDNEDHEAQDEPKSLPAMKKPRQVDGEMNGATQAQSTSDNQHQAPTTGSIRNSILFLTEKISDGAENSLYDELHGAPHAQVQGFDDPAFAEHQEAMESEYPGQTDFEQTQQYQHQKWSGYQF